MHKEREASGWNNVCENIFRDMNNWANRVMSRVDALTRPLDIKEVVEQEAIEFQEPVETFHKLVKKHFK